MSNKIIEPIKTRTIGKFMNNLRSVNEQDMINSGVDHVPNDPNEVRAQSNNSIRRLTKTKTLRVSGVKLDMDDMKEWSAFDKKNPPRKLKDQKFWKKGVSKQFANDIPNKLTYHEPITVQFLDEYFRDINRKTALMVQHDYDSEDDEFKHSIKWRHIHNYVPNMSANMTTKEHCIELVLDDAQKNILKSYDIAQRLLYNLYSKYVYNTFNFEKGWSYSIRYDIRNNVNNKIGLTKKEEEQVDFIYEQLPNAIRETIWRKVLGNFKSIYTEIGNKVKFKMPKMRKSRDYTIHMSTNGYRVSYDGINVMPTIFEKAKINSFFKFNQFGCKECIKRDQQPDKCNANHVCSDNANKKYKRELKMKVDDMLSNTFRGQIEIVGVDGEMATITGLKRTIIKEKTTVHMNGVKTVGLFYKPQCGEIRIKFDYGTGKYLLLFAAHCKIPPNPSDKIAAFDPGLRTVLTIVDNAGNAYCAGEPVLKKARNFANIQVTKKIKNKRDFRGVRKRRHAIDRFTKDYYAKLAKYIAMNYRAVIAPESALFFSRGQRTPFMKHLQRMIHHTEFTFRLKEACELYGCEYLFAREWFTSITCSNCGKVNRRFREKNLECKHCRKTIDRDINGAKNMMIRFLTKSKQYNE